MSFAEAFQKEMFALKSRAEKGLHQIGKQIKLDTNDNIPVASGDLRNSYEFEVEKTPTGFILSVGYASQYAEKQHEETLNHVSKAPIRKSFQEFIGHREVGVDGEYYWRGFWKAIENKETIKFPAKFLEKSMDENAKFWIDILGDLING